MEYVCRVGSAKTMCWLCSYQGEALGKKMHEFIIKHIGVMDLHCIAQQVSDYLLIKEPQALGATKDDVYAHIAAHMLQPRVRTAVLLRQLLEFANLLQTNLVVQQDGMYTFDKANAELYLKVINQIMTLYKADTQNMLFSTEETEKKD